ncbi:MAG: hypothetical protein IPN19_13565 [Elusimicrobia bacterium]|nr:hypothetical protein [Elusimicrobiota bacterium]
MSVPMIGPGPLEGGPKGPPGSAKNADGFSACLKEECGREGAPAGDPLPPEGAVSAKSVLPAEPEQLFQPTSTSSPEQSVDTTPAVVPSVLGLLAVSVDTVPAVAPSVLELLADGLDPTIPIQLDTNSTLALDVISAGAVEPFVDGDLPQLTVEDSTEKEESDTDTPSPLKELAASFPAVPVSSPVPLVVAVVPLAVIVPDTDRSFSTEGLKVETAESSSSVETVSGPGRVSNTDFVTPVVDNSKRRPRAAFFVGTGPGVDPSSGGSNVTSFFLTPGRERSSARGSTNAGFISACSYDTLPGRRGLR